MIINKKCPILTILFVLISLLLPLKNIAQNYSLQFERVSIAEGLSQSSIQAIAQDEQGFLWFGTQDGLNRFDGYQFRIYKHDPQDSLTISDDWINALTCDRSGNLWIGTAGGGLNKYDLRTETFERIDISNSSSENSGLERITAVKFDTRGDLWIGTDGAGLHVIDPVSLEIRTFKGQPELGKISVTGIFSDRSGNLMIATNGHGLIRINIKNGQALLEQRWGSDQKDPFRLTSDLVQTVYQDTNGLIWIGTDNGLNLYNPSENSISTFRANPSDIYALSNDKVFDIYEDKYSNLWIATDGGLNLFRRDQRTFQTFSYDPSDGSTLSNDLVRIIFPENSGTIWVGTYGGGLNVFNWQKSRFALYNNIPGDPNSINDNTVWSILDRKDILWVGTNKGLNRLDRKKNKIKIYRHDPEDHSSLSDDIIRVIYSDRQGKLWLGTNDGGLNRLDPQSEALSVFKNIPSDPKSLSNNTVRCIFEDSERNLWVGTWGGLNKLDRKTGTFRHYVNIPGDTSSISDNRVRSIYQDRNGILWIGTYGGLNKFDPGSEKFSVYLTDPDNPNSISHDRVLAIHGDREGILWIGTYGGGFNRFDPSSGTFEHFTEKQGLANNAIYGILEDSDDNLWISTNQGISCFNKITRTFKNYDTNDGLQSNEFNGGAYFRNEKGEMFFGGINGLNSFYPDELITTKFQPPIRITAFRVFEKMIPMERSIAYTTALKLSHKQNFFSFEFAALDYNNPEKNQYAYMLEGFDLDWVMSRDRRYASYTNLDGGSYVFKVRGSNSDGVWSELPASVSITIIPPLWQRAWFRILAGLLIIGLVFGGFRFQLNKVERQKRKLEKEVSLRTQEINERNTELTNAKRQTDSILNNVEEGLFLLNNKLEIESQYSLATESVFHTTELAGRPFLGLLEGGVSTAMFTSAREYLELMLNRSVDEITLTELNPLSNVELAFEGNGSAQHLAFKFRRICDQDHINGLIATVVDISDQIKLANELEASEIKTRKQMEWLLSILHVEAPLLREFIDGVQKEVDLIEKVMRNEEKQPYNEVLEIVYRSVNTIKGNASLLDLKYFINGAQEFEEKIVQIRAKEQITGNDFVALILKLGEMKKSISEINNLIDRISQIRSHFRPKRAYENQLLINSLRNLVKTLAEDLHREVRLVDKDFDADVIPYKYHILVKDVLVQMIRNAVRHGIEDPGERAKAGKPRIGRIRISTVKFEQAFALKIRDDGRGIDVDKLHQKIADSGIWDPSETVIWSESQVIRAIFSPGITTADKADYVSGRGMGLDIVRHMVEENQGKIEIDFQAGVYTEFTVTLPDIANDKVFSDGNVREEIMAPGELE